MAKKDWIDYLRKMNQKDRNRLLKIVIDRLLETEEIAFREKNDEDHECFYWPGSGEDVLEGSE